jgi:effector-binding domain-containing protein
MYDGEYREEDARFEPCAPVRRKVNAEGIAVRELTDQHCLALVHRGPYSELGRSYEKLMRFARVS